MYIFKVLSSVVSCGRVCKPPQLTDHRHSAMQDRFQHSCVPAKEGMLQGKYSGAYCFSPVCATIASGST